MDDMRFRQIDQITHLETGRRIEAKKFLVGNEDYLRDHFPRFAVMPGVLMLESLYQAAAFLVRDMDQYQSGLVMLKTVRNVKFADFVQPGQTLDIEVDLFKHEGSTYTVKAVGKKGDSIAVSGRLILECLPPDDTRPVDKHAGRFMRQLSEHLQRAGMAG